ncbi:MAG: HD-GYP domain-containing protein [Acidaminobacteraceae bacterium]
MKLVTIENIVEGMILEKDVINDGGITFLSKGTVLNETHVDGLGKLGFDFVYISHEEIGLNKSTDKKMIVIENLNREFENTIRVYKSLYMSARLDKKLDVDEAKQSISGILKAVISTNDVMNTMRKVTVDDIYTYRHSINVCVYCAMIAKWLKLSYEQMQEVALAGLLHDIGKSKISIKILNKMDTLTTAEFSEIKLHTEFSRDILKNLSNVSKKIIDGVHHHHESISGGGYPIGMVGEEIGLYARIVAVADTYDALLSDRVYCKKISPYKALDVLKDESFTRLDPEICTVFIKNISDFYVGNLVKLSNGKLGEVILLNKHSINRPFIKTTNTYIDLSADYSIDIVDVIESRIK